MSRAIVTKSDLAPYWPLAVPNMGLWDKLKIAKWILTEDRWTQGTYVRDYEARWERYTGAPYVIMVANGSVANELIALRRKSELERLGYWPRQNKVVFPVVNWISSISPWVNLGFEPIFIDVGANLCSTPEQVRRALEGRDDVAAVFYTSLLGFSGGVHDILRVCGAANVPLYLDNCESSFSHERYRDPGDWQEYTKHISNIVTSSTSLYFSHHTSGQCESGLLFCQDKEEADWYRMARNHGMSRGMDLKYQNPDVDPSFDFYLMGSNYRSSNLLAYLCSLDLDRAIAFGEERRAISSAFSMRLHPERFETPHGHLGRAIPLSLPIVTKPNGYDLIEKVKVVLKERGVEYRSVVGSNLLYQTAFKRYGDPKAFPRADHIHHNGIYIGLHKGVTREMVVNLTTELNAL